MNRERGAIPSGRHSLLPGSANRRKFGVCLLADQRNDFVPVGDVDRFHANMRLGVAAAVPVEILATRTPAAPVVLAEHKDELVVAVLVLSLLVRAPYGKLPAHLGLGLDEWDALTGSQMMQGAAVASGEVPVVVEDAAVTDDAGLLTAVLLDEPALLLADRMLLPGALIQLRNPGGHALSVLLLGEVSAKCTATRVWTILVDALAAIAEDAGPPRGQPGEVSPDDLVGVGGVDKFDPLARKVKGNLGHGDTLWLALGYRRSVRMGVLDIGSNTVHLLLVDAHHGAAPIPASKRKIPLRLAEHLTPDGNVDDSAVRTLIEFIREGQTLAEDMGASEVMAFATSAIRDAANGEEVLRLVRDETGQGIEVLSGEDEARITFLAVRRWYGWSTGRLLVMDIGGGSLELASGLDEEPDVAVSVPLGAGRLTRSHLPNDPPTDDEVRALRRYARAEIAEVLGRIRRAGEPQMAVATSKTFKQLARIAGAAPSSEGIYVRRELTVESIRTILANLSGMTASERAAIPGVSEGRAGQLLAGAVVAEAAMELLEVPRLAICPWALREGVILERMDRLPA